MKTITTILKKSFWRYGLVSLALLGAFLYFIPREHPSSAASCTGNSGNLSGYITTTNLGDIYVSDASWDADHPSTPASVPFYVSYNAENNTWSGRGWNEMIGWVDFSYDTPGRRARFEAPGEEYDRLHDSDPNNDEPVEWGNWQGVADLSGVHYSVQQGAFVGKGIDIDSNTGGGDPDEPVGSGEWDFTNVHMQNVACPEDLNLLLNQKVKLHYDTCPVRQGDVVIQWTSEGVNACESIEGPWDLIPRPSKYTASDLHPNADISSSARFTIRCFGDYTGMPIKRSAVVSCGASDAGGDSGGAGAGTCPNGECPIIAPTYQEA